MYSVQEYKTVSVATKEDLQTNLKLAGDKGWELKFVETLTAGKGNTLVLIFHRKGSQGTTG